MRYRLWWARKNIARRFSFAAAFIRRYTLLGTALRIVALLLVGTVSIFIIFALMPKEGEVSYEIDDYSQIEFPFTSSRYIVDYYVEPEARNTVAWISAEQVTSFDVRLGAIRVNGETIWRHSDQLSGCSIVIEQKEHKRFFRMTPIEKDETYPARHVISSVYSGALSIKQSLVNRYIYGSELEYTLMSTNENENIEVRCFFDLDATLVTPDEHKFVFTPEMDVVFEGENGFIFIDLKGEALKINDFVFDEQMIMRKIEAALVQADENVVTITESSGKLRFTGSSPTPVELQPSHQTVSISNDKPNKALRLSITETPILNETATTITGQASHVLLSDVNLTPDFRGWFYGNVEVFAATIASSILGGVLLTKRKNK